MDEVAKQKYLVEIKNMICSRTAMNFQNSLRNILSVYYEKIGKTFEMPQPYGGDYKNDGWVKEDAIFYIIYSPTTSYARSITKDIKQKFVRDIEGLFKHVYVDGMWGGKINKVVYIVNLIDNDLPPDQNCEYEATCNKLKQEYNLDFSYEIIAGKSFCETLNNLNNEELRTIKLKLNAIEAIDLNVPSGKDVLDVIDKISGALNSYVVTGKKNDCNRISTIKKIKINHLEEKQEEINKILEDLPIVGNAIGELLQSDNEFAKFELTRDYIINLYKELSNDYEGAKMYDKLVSELLAIVSMSSFIVPIKFLILYIFDRCDIFEKE